MMARLASSVTGMIARAATAAARLAAAVLALQITSGSAGARAPNDQEKASLSRTVADFDKAFREARYDDVVAVVPPRIVAAIAKKNGVTVEKLKPAMADVITKVLAAVKVESFSIDMGAAEYKELPNGAPYALIPTKTVIDAGDKGRFAEATFSLAFIDDGKWYVIRVNDVANLMIMRSVYPEFAGVELPGGSMEILKQ